MIDKRTLSSFRCWFILGVIVLTTACQAPAMEDRVETHVQNLPFQQAEEGAAATSPLATPESQAANADVEFVRVRRSGDGTWTFNVTVRHPDSGWEDYANGWDVVLADGTVVKANDSDPFTRLLLHPHENEQPFTRSQSGLIIPETVTVVTVRAHDLVAGWGGREVIVDLNQRSGPSFEVEP